MKALVTGATGFLGGNLVRELAKRHCEVVAIGREIEARDLHLPAQTYSCNFDAVPWHRIGPIDIVFHFAAINNTRCDNQEEIDAVNVHAARSLFESAVAHHCRHIVYASSIHIYGNAPVPMVETGPAEPLNAYGKSKKKLEEITRDFGATNPECSFVGIRYSNVYGPGEGHKGPMASMVRQLALQMQRGDPTMFEYGDQERDFVFVNDAIDATIRAATLDRSIVVNCGLGTGVRFNTLLKELNAVMGMSRKPHYIKNPNPATYQNRVVLSMERARTLLGFSPKYTISDGIREYYKSGHLVTSESR